MNTPPSPPRGKRRLIIALIAAAFVVGYLLRGGPADSPATAPTSAPTHDHAAASAPAERQPDFWTCAMHPQIQLPDSGKCPICGMDLIPYYSESTEDASPRRLVMSPAAMELADIQTTPVTRRMVETEVRMVGKIAYDETRLGYITTRFPGRIDELHVDYTGVTVRKGDHMADLYSPELISAQEELFQALKAHERLKMSELEIMRETAASTVEAARRKLQLWDLTPEQIAEIEHRKTLAKHTTIYSPMTGIVIHREGTEGMYVQTGTRLYTIARLDKLWVLLEAYESDVAWLRYGQDVEFTTEAYPGQTFHGRIAFIDPVLNPKTRTIAVRLNVENAEGKLKPDMFVRATVHSALAKGGAVVDPSLAGKWIGPMHPEIVRDEPGDCPICGMPLVRPEDLGLMPAMPPSDASLVIPTSAPLITGKRAVVYVALPNPEKPTYEGREISLGPRAGDYYIVLDGLREGEEVVTQGNFKIDSALQIQAKPSMMSPEGGVPQMGHAGHGDMGAAADTSMEPMEMPTGPSPAEQAAASRNRTLQAALEPVFTRYFALQAALADDAFAQAHTAFAALHQDVRTVPLELVDDAEKDLWRPPAAQVEAAAAHGMKAQTLAETRMAFQHLSEAMIAIEKLVGHAEGPTYYEAFCPMFNQGNGASWLQTAKEIQNPYYGSLMRSCGLIQSTYDPHPAPASQPSAPPGSAPTSRPATSPIPAPAGGPADQSHEHAH